ncbi:helix-turn-helix domain-containing protein [Nonomuraea candida]|uniref:helix-turn-helix domain-containing protein n=1 Tax=Nonomuraea candida TaxID=359159 RepID=UPI000AE2E6B9|nr:helix-turn-helix domain-containing protein [Nonomuraea candida]
MSDTWTIGELAEHAARALRAGAPPPASGRVREVPGERLIRWYTTIGLLDPPLTRRGRVARYGRRHLLQLVAVKRLQAAGHSIAEIQAALAGATDRTLETAARLPGQSLPDALHPQVVASEPHPRPATDGPRPPAAVPPRPPLMPAARAGVSGDAMAGGGDRAGRRDDGRGGEPGRGRFWAERPGSGRVAESAAAGTAGPPGVAETAGTGTAETGTAGTDTAGTGNGGVQGAGSRGVAGGVVVGVRLGDGVRVVLDAGRVPSEEDVQAVLAAAGPLLAVLEERKLI